MTCEAFRKARERQNKERGFAANHKLSILLSKIQAAEDQAIVTDSEDKLVPGDLWQEILSAAKELKSI